MSTGRPGRRAILRWARRLLRREWRQQVLVLALSTLAVAGAVAGSAVAVNAASHPGGALGEAGALIEVGGVDPELARSGLDAARERFGPLDVTAHASVAVPGSVEPLDVRDQDPAARFSGPRLAVLHGRLPTAPGEVALTDGTAQRLDAALGSTVVLGPTTATVVGSVEDTGRLSDEFALVAPGALTAPDSHLVLIDPDEARGEPIDVPGQTRVQVGDGGTRQEDVMAAVLATSTLALVLVGLVAAAGFLVVAQRRQRQLGLLVAIGATDRQVRLVMVANGAMVGLIAAVVGTAAGLGAWLLAAPAVESAADQRIDRFDLPWGLILTVMALAVVVATMAAWWPARTASRLPVMAALSGRPAPPPPVHRSLLLAAALLVGGVAGMAVAQPRSERVQPLLLVAGLLGVTVGTVLASPAAVRALGPLARRLPLAPRLALRDLARYQARAAAALAAITLGLGIAVAVIGISAADQPSRSEGNLSDRELLVRVGNPLTAPDPDLTTEQLDALDDRAASVMATLGDDSRAVALDVAVDPSASGDVRRAPGGLGLVADPHSVELLGPPHVATPEVLAGYGIDPTSIDAATELLSATDGPFTLLDGQGPPKVDPPLAVTQVVDLPTHSSAPSTLITEAALARMGWVPARAGWIVESAEPLTSAQVDAAEDAAAEVGLAVEVRTAADGLDTLRTGSVVVGALLAMAIVALAVSLVRGESASDLRTLTATGAAARTRRALAASTAAALAVLGVVLGLVGGYVALLATYRSDLGALLPLPLSELRWLVVGLPLAATAVGWLLAGREPRSFSRQALD